MRQQFRPYSLTIHEADISDEVPITLKDSAGNKLKCNYISLTVSGGAEVGFVRMSADFPNLTTPQANFKSPAASIGVDSSGVPSVFTIPSGEAATMVLSDRDRVDSVKVQSNEPGEVILILTYGQVSVGNNLRDQDRPAGN